MSWVFLAGGEAFKLKKPVRFPYLDFSNLRRREAACRAELALNRRLAPDVYKTVAPVVRSSEGLAIGGLGTGAGETGAGETGLGETVDWLVVMRRLDPDAPGAHREGVRPGPVTRRSGLRTRPSPAICVRSVTPPEDPGER